MFVHSLERVSRQARRGPLHAAHAAHAARVARVALGCMGLGVAFTLGACIGDAARTDARASDAESAGGSAPAGAASPGVSTEGDSTDTMGAPREVIARGDSIFHGLAAGGTYQVCHGAQGTGGTLAPDLTDATWLHGDGSRAALVRIVTSGVAVPKQYPAPMPPLGGASLTPADVRAVAAYVSALRGTRP